MPSELTAAGVGFHAIDRADSSSIGRLVGSGADLLVDAVAYRAADVRAILPLYAAADAVVVISGKAVYTDEEGRHVNSDQAPRFRGPVREDAPTLEPAGDEVDRFSRGGYGPCKVAVEREALDSGLPVTVIRPSKVHGRWARQARTGLFVERMLAAAATVALADRGAGVDHITAAANTAELVRVVAGRPGARVLNSADPDAPDAARIVRAIGDRLGWTGELLLLEPDDPSGVELRHPWQTASPIVLDMSVALGLGYVPVGEGLALLSDEVDWVAAGRVPRG